MFAFYISFYKPFPPTLLESYVNESGLGTIAFGFSRYHRPPVEEQLSVLLVCDFIGVHVNHMKWAKTKELHGKILAPSSADPKKKE